MSRNANGRFRGTQVAVADLGAALAVIEVKVDGKLAQTRASGTLSAVVKISDKASGAAVTSCQTGSQRWSAARAPGIVYGGATSQGEPFVVRLDARRTRVNDVRTTWRAPCSPSGGFFRVPEHFVNFPLKRTGGFGNPMTGEFPIDAGGKRRYDYTFAGRVSRRSAKGTLRVKVAETDAAGAPVDSCDTGGLSWKAATG
jgi:hypothetical protein